MFFPDVENVKPLVGSNRPEAILGARPHLQNLPAWLMRVISFWGSAGGFQALGPLGIRLVEEIFCTSIEIKPLLVSELDDEERIRVRLTEQQARVLRVIGGRKRAVIAGGAGTGKTLIAVEKARRSAEAWGRVLLLCYNRPLADALAQSMTDVKQIHVMSFHQLCERRTAQVRKETGRDLMKEAEAAYPGTSDHHRFDVQMPIALALRSRDSKD